MDFSTGKEKIKNNDYQWMEELKDSFQLMCTNAMLYNKPEAIYYKAAKKLLRSGMKILSGENSAHRLHGRLAEESKAERQNRHLTEQGRWWLLASRREDSSETSQKHVFKSQQGKQKEKDMLEDESRSNNLEREQENDCIIKEP